jgi:hypothetical protein
MDFDKLNRIEYSYDGTQIKLYYYNGSWRVATTRGINAFRSKWGSNKSFGEMFEDAVDRYPGMMERLDRKHVYGFVLMHPENKLVVKYQEPNIVHVITRNTETWEECDVDIGVPKPKVVYNGNNVNAHEEEIRSQEEIRSEEELVWKLKEETNEQLEYEGSMLVGEDGKRMKVLYEKYQHLSNLRGNMRKAEYRMFELRNEPVKMMEFVYYYDLFDEYRTFMKKYQNMVNKVQKYYYSRYIAKQVGTLTDLPFFVRNVVYKLHQNYIETHNIMTRERVAELFVNFPTEQLYFVYNRI